MNALDILPLELWREIAMKQVKTWSSLCLVVRGVFRDSDNSKMKDKDLVSVERTIGGRRIEMLVLDGKIHREIGMGPAAVGANGDVMWFYRGKKHRDPKVGPASICVDSKINPGGRIEYAWEGQLHRDPEDGPALIVGDETMYAWRGLMHRPHEQGPAKISRYILKYMTHGKYHRPFSQGPAILFPRSPDLEEEYAMHGHFVKFEVGYPYYEDVSSLF